MAITQISRIQNRRGLKENLPTLSDGELGWSVDTRELYIGNGNVLVSPQPNVNVRLLTEIDLVKLGISLSNISNTVIQNSNLTSNAVANVAAIIASSLGSTIINYSISRDLTGNLDQRTGTMKISSLSDSSSVTYEDDYTETANIGITLYPNVTINSGEITLLYDSSPGNVATLITNSFTFI